ncbi:MAG: GC-type dockerin domain-anchored protein [Planctomycetota bacterium]
MTARSRRFARPVVATLALAACCMTAHAQTFYQRLAGFQLDDQFQDIRTVRAGGAIAVGATTTPDGTRDFYIVRTAPSGDPAWIRVLAWPGDDIAYSVQEVADGFVVAGETRGDGDSDLNLAVAKLDPAGNLLWAFRYTGAYMGDTVHAENPGPTVRRAPDEFEPLETTITHRVFQNALPSYLALDNAGNIVVQRFYFATSPRQEGEAELSFTDHRFSQDSGDLRVTGTIQSQPVGAPAGFAIRDIAYVRIDPPTGAITFNAAYAPFPTPPGEPESPVDAWGHAITLTPEGVAIAGDTTLGASFLSIGNAAHYIMQLDDPGNVLNMVNALPQQDPGSVGFGALALEEQPPVLVVAGRNNASGTGFTTAFDFPSLAPVWAHNYGRVPARLDAIVDSPECGLLAAGRWNAADFAFGNDDAWWLSTQDGGPETGCFDQPRDLEANEGGAEPLDFQMSIDGLDNRIPWPVDPAGPEPVARVLCDAPCCPADLAPPFGVLDFFDVLEFLSLFSANDPAADLAPPFGVWDFFDVLEYLSLFDAGC